MTKQELKPCPFCGSQAKSDLSDFGSAMVYCGAEDVGVDCPVNAETGFHDSMESSIAAWNARPADPLTGELVEALENLSAAADHHTAATAIAYNAVMDHSRSAYDCIDEENRSRKDFEIAQCQARAALARWKDGGNG